MHIDKSFMLTWAALYEQSMGSTEPWLLEEVGPAAAARGHYEPAELTAVARWKTPRSQPSIAANSSREIREITAMAFAAPESLQHRALTLVKGVGVPTASALLAVAFPDRHTIIDVRSTESLGRLDEWDGQGGYLSYLDVCRKLATRLGVTLRTLDRALWRWSKHDFPAP